MVNFIKLFVTIMVISLLTSCAQSQPHKKDVVSEIITIVGVAPNYPKNAAVNKIEGEVTVEFTVTKTGTVKNPVVISSTPKGIFDQEAIRAILKYKFKPRLINQNIVETVATQTFYFKLNKDDLE